MSSPTNRRQQSMLWHLMEEGSLKIKDIERLTGWANNAVRVNIAALMARTLVRRVDEPRTNPAVYGLTPLGIEAALLVLREDVHFAPVPPVVTATAAITVTAEEKMAVTAPPAPVTSDLASSADAAQDDSFECATLAVHEGFVGMVDTNGVLLISLNEEDAVMFSAKAALKLQRLLASITFLERLEAEGSL